MRLDLPHFSSEAEEANWWFEHQDEIAEAYQKEHPEEFRAGSVQFVAADVIGEDADLLRQRAEALGMEPQAYAVKLIHDALHQAKAA